MLDCIFYSFKLDCSIFRRNSNLLSILQTQERKFEGVNLLHMSKQIYTFTLRFSIICKFEIYHTSFEIYSFLKCLVAKQSKFEISNMREVIFEISNLRSLNLQ